MVTVTDKPVQQYPSTLKSAAVETDSVLDENGNWVPGTLVENEVEVPCRAVSSSSNGFIPSAGGQRLDYSWIVYMPWDAPELQEGTTVEIFKDGMLEVSDTVKRFHRGQRNSRAWL